MLHLMRSAYAARWAYAFLLPALVPFVLFTVLPLLQGLQLSLYTRTLKLNEFVGFGNFQRLATDPVFHKAVVNTLLFTALLVPVAMVIALFVAVVAYPFGRFLQTFVRVSFYVPLIAGGVILALVWRWILHPTYGLLNYLIGLVGLGPVAWLGTTESALATLVLVVLSFGLGKPVILYLAALGTIPHELYEAARIDGANAWRELRHVTLPLLRPATLFILVTETIGSFQVFVVVLLLTQGGPAYATQTIVYRIYETAFDFNQFGYASAMATVLMAMLGAIAYLQFRFVGKEISY
jgi:multiple sugar transport system permease protein